MYQRTEDEFNSNARYYASPQEQKILIQGLQQYFSLPERSQNRNKIAQSVSMYLRTFSRHWTHRAVRLWFNNNKHTYLTTIPGVNSVVDGQPYQDNKMINAQPMIPNQNFAMNPTPMPPQQIVPQPIAPMPQMIPNTIINQPNYPNMIQGQMMPTYQYPPMPNYQMAPPPIIPSYQPPINQDPSINQPMNQPNPLNPTNNQQPSPYSNQPKPKTAMKSESATKIILPPISIASAVAAQQQPQSNGSHSVSPLSSSGSLNKIKNSPISVTSPKSTNPQSTSISGLMNETNDSTLTRSSLKWTTLPESQDQSTTNAALQEHPEGTQTNKVELQNYTHLSSIINEIREIDQVFVSDKEQLTNEGLTTKFARLVNKFDENLFQMLSQYGFVIPERIEPSIKYVRFIFPLDPTTTSFSFLRSGSRLDIDSASMTGFTNDQSISSLFPFSMSNFDLSMYSPSPSFMQLQQIANDPSFSNLNNTNGHNASTTSTVNKTDDNSIVHSNSNSGSDDNEGNTGKEGLYERVGPANIFQSRLYIDEKMTYFDICSMNDEYAVYTSTTLGATQRNMYILNYKEKIRYMLAHPEEPYENSTGKFVNIHMIESAHPIDSITVDHKNVWMLSRQNVIKYEIAQMSVPQVTISLSENKVVNPLESQPPQNDPRSALLRSNNDTQFENGFITVFNKNRNDDHSDNMNAVICYPSSKTLYFVNENTTSFAESAVMTLETKYAGFTNVATLYNDNERLLCAVKNSSCIRLINPNYTLLEERTFVGHCGQVRGIEPISDFVFISRADDQTVRIWDIRERGSGPISTIATPQVSPISLSGDDCYIVCGYHNKYIGVVDLRMDFGTPILGVNTQDYDAVALRYRQEDDSLAMIGVQERDSNKDSLMFVDPNKKCVFRYYSRFIGFDTE